MLSGGEAARLLFCKLMLLKPNFLIFDEPTNHLDLESINALNIALQRYQGTVILASHDHDLIDEVATRIWHFENDHTLTDFKGTYEEQGFIADIQFRRSLFTVPVGLLENSGDRFQFSICLKAAHHSLEIIRLRNVQRGGSLGFGAQRRAGCEL